MKFIGLSAQDFINNCYKITVDTVQYNIVGRERCKKRDGGATAGGGGGGAAGGMALVLSLIRFSGPEKDRLFSSGVEN